jgi:hypothetical protein
MNTRVATLTHFTEWSSATGCVSYYTASSPSQYSNTSCVDLSHKLHKIIVKAFMSTDFTPILHTECSLMFVIIPNASKIEINLWNSHHKMHNMDEMWNKSSRAAVSEPLSVVCFRLWNIIRAILIEFLFNVQRKEKVGKICYRICKIIWWKLEVQGPECLRDLRFV